MRITGNLETLMCIVDSNRKNWCVIGSWHWIWCNMLTCCFRQTFHAGFCQSYRCAEYIL